MFEQELFINYAGMNATAEILIMLAGAFALGYVLRWVQNKIWGCEHCVETELEAELRAINDRSDRIAYKQIDTEINTETTVTSKVIEAETTSLPAGVTENDLKIVEGIGPKIESLLVNAGIDTWKDLGQSSVGALRTVLANAGDGFHMHDPSTWPQQAKLAHEGKWNELGELQDVLNS